MKLIGEFIEKDNKYYIRTNYIFDQHPYGKKNQNAVASHYWRVSAIEQDKFPKDGAFLTHSGAGSWSGHAGITCVTDDKFPEYVEIASYYRKKDGSNGRFISLAVECGEKEN